MIIAQISDTHITQVGGKADHMYATATRLLRPEHPSLAVAQVPVFRVRCMRMRAVVSRTVDFAIHIADKGEKLLTMEGANLCRTHSTRKSTWFFGAAYQIVEILHV